MQLCKEGERIDACLWRRHAELCGVFASIARLEILWLLGEGEKTAGELCMRMELPAPNVSQHLRIMRDQRVVLTRREGRCIFYRVANRKYLEALRLVREALYEDIEKHHARSLVEQALS